MAILITGAAGFIGFHVAKSLLQDGVDVIGVDNLNDYYPVALKQSRLSLLQAFDGFTFDKIDIADFAALKAACAKHKIEKIIHLAAQAGVRYSIENPFAYGRSNLDGHLSMLELARALKTEHFVYASSSSIYGANTKTPFSETDMTDSPVSLYGATKKSDELMSSAYAQLYRLPMTGLRFFTVYGPWGRPDMAYWIFTEKMLRGEPIDIFNHGRMARDFTFIDDIVNGVLAALERPPAQEHAFHRVYNLGNDHPEELMTMVSLLEKHLELEAKKKFRDMQPGDVERTWADIGRARAELGYSPKTSLEDGLRAYVEWRRATPADAIGG